MNAKRWISLASLVAVAAVLVWATTGCKKEPQSGAGPTHSSPSRGGTAQAATVQTTCPVMGNPINKDIFVEYEGKKVYFCCPACVDQFKADPEKYLDKLPQFKDAQKAAEQTSADMSTAAEGAVKGAAEAAGQAVEGATQAVEGAASAAGSLLAAATEQTTCPIMGNPINKDVFVEYKGQKVYFCCEDCKAKFNADPEKYVANLPQFKK